MLEVASRRNQTGTGRHASQYEARERPADHASQVSAGFRHESLFYSGSEGFLSGTLPFIMGGLVREEPVLVAVVPERERLLRRALGARAGEVSFIDMYELGRNPARIIPAWRAFLDSRGAGGQPVRGIGEPIWPGRSDAEVCECQRHESLLNTAFDGGPAWRLLCPYDIDGLDEGVIEGAHGTHPYVVHDGESRASALYLRGEEAPGPFAGSLPAPGGPFQEIVFTGQDLRAVRGTVACWAEASDLDALRSEDLVLAVDELASNSASYGGGEGRLRIWREGTALLCEVCDAGTIVEPLTGRLWPLPEQLGGRGLWLVNHLCDLVQIRSGRAGTAVRVRMETR